MTSEILIGSLSMILTKIAYLTRRLDKWRNYMEPNYPNFKRSLRALDKRDIERIKHATPPAPHDQVRVSKLGKREKIKDRREKS